MLNALFSIRLLCWTCRYFYNLLEKYILSVSSLKHTTLHTTNYVRVYKIVFELFKCLSIRKNLLPGKLPRCSSDYKFPTVLPSSLYYAPSDSQEMTTGISETQSWKYVLNRTLLTSKLWIHYDYYYKSS